MAVTDAGLETLRYPIGRFVAGPPGTAEQRGQWIDEIARTPQAVTALVAGLTPRQMATPYRDGGWTVAQTVHHMADSHVNAYLRTRWALTEDGFVVKPYPEQIWAELPDAREIDVTPSLAILTGVHARWVTLLRTLTPEAFARAFVHPERGDVTLDWLIQMYAWHGRHHAGHISSLRSREGW